MSTTNTNWALPEDKRANWDSDHKQNSYNLMQKLPSLLRILGAGALIIAMYSFLAKGWQSGNDIARYLMMLGHTGILVVIGLASGHYLKESKGARLLITLALISIPANFAILGALIYSQSGAMVLDMYPQYVAWSADSLSTALVTTACATVLLIPLTWLGFTVLARSLSKNLSILFLVGNAALLLPIRSPELIGLLVLALTVGTLIFNRQTSRHQTVAKTSEGITALGLMFPPIAILMGRNLWIYSTDLFLLCLSTAGAFVILRQISAYTTPESKWRNLLNISSLIPASATPLLLAACLDEINIVPKELLLPIGAIVSALMIYDIASRSTQHSHNYRNFANTGLLFALLLNMLFFDGYLPALFNTGIGLGLILWGFKEQQRNLLIYGSILLTSGIAQQLYFIVQNFDLGGWVSLASLGIIAIVAASLMESRGEIFINHLATLKKKLQNWEQ